MELASHDFRRMTDLLALIRPKEKCTLIAIATFSRLHLGMIIQPSESDQTASELVDIDMRSFYSYWPAAGSSFTFAFRYPSLRRVALR